MEGHRPDVVYCSGEFQKTQSPNKTKIVLPSTLRVHLCLYQCALGAYTRTPGLLTPKFPLGPPQRPLESYQGDDGARGSGDARDSGGARGSARASSRSRGRARGSGGAHGAPVPVPVAPHREPENLAEVHLGLGCRIMHVFPNGMHGFKKWQWAWRFRIGDTGWLQLGHAGEELRVAHSDIRVRIKILHSFFAHLDAAEANVDDADGAADADQTDAPQLSPQLAVYPFITRLQHKDCLMDWDSLMDCQGVKSQKEGQGDQGEVEEI